MRFLYWIHGFLLLGTLCPVHCLITTTTESTNQDDTTYFCTAFVDLIILAESSNVTKFEYNQETSWHPGIVVFLINLLQQLEMGRNAFKIAIILYSSGLDDVMTFTTNKNFGSNSILYLQPKFGGNRLDQALEFAIRMFDYYNRKDAVKRVVLLSGSPSESLPETFLQVAKAKSMGVDFVAVGFGPHYDISEINMMAPGWVLTVPDAGMLYSIVDRIAERVCQSPIHGQWSEWNSWIQCSVSCGSGVKSRSRDCSNPSPNFGGKYCEGTGEEDIGCNIQKCFSLSPVSDWSSWSTCTSTCGKGTSMRTRQCSNCNLENLEVEQRNCELSPCPVHGGWSDWSGWSSCDCIHGTRERIRKCNNPMPQHNGQNCFGFSRILRTCNHLTSGNCPVNGHWTEWSAWSYCSVSCGNGSVTRIRQCNNPAPKNGGETCKGYTIDTSICVNNPCLEQLQNETVKKNITAHSCKWKDGAGYGKHENNCAKYLQCTYHDPRPLERWCPHGLLWNNEILQCVLPHQSDCNICDSEADGFMMKYDLSCREYWECYKNGQLRLLCCNNTSVYVENKGCIQDTFRTCFDQCTTLNVTEGNNSSNYSEECEYRTSEAGNEWYEEKVHGQWSQRPCPPGTQFSTSECMCATITKSNSKAECADDVNMTCKNLTSDIENSAIEMTFNNVAYLQNDSVFVGEKSNITLWQYSNMDIGSNFILHIIFKPLLPSGRQYIIHNSECESQKMPSIFIEIENHPDGAEMFLITVGLLLKDKEDSVEAFRTSTLNSNFIDIYLKLNTTNIVCIIDGQNMQKSVFSSGGIARRKSALYIGGDSCQPKREPFSGLLKKFFLSRCWSS